MKRTEQMLQPAPLSWGPLRLRKTLPYILMIDLV